MSFTVQIMDCMVNNGQDEEGQPNVVLMNYVVVEYDNGRRLAHFRYEEDHNRLLPLAKRVESALNCGNPLNDVYWTEIDPRYGSEYHQQIGDKHLMSHDELVHNLQSGYIS